MDELRRTRVADRMREELSELIRFESSDPRLTQVDVTDVIVTADSHRADVLVRLPAGASERQSALDGLEHARMYLRRQLMQRLSLFRMPELRFVPDSQTGASAPVSRLARRIRRGRPKE